MSSGRVPGLQFSCKELVDEIAALMKMAEHFLYLNGELAAFKNDLERIGEGPAGCDMQLSLRSLCTRPTRNYEPGSRSGGLEVYARIMGKWQVRPVGTNHSNRKIAFTGSASAVVELWPKCSLWREENDQSSRLAMWRIELGSYDSPGCYFHSQILGDCVHPPFPKSIPIPRLPSPFVTPMAVVEFVLGELFQDVWSQTASEARHHHQRWRSIQRQRWSSLLKWQRDTLDRGVSSPWINLKEAKPPDNLFLSS